MEPYDVCVMSGEDPLVITFYTSVEAYKDFNPSKIYVIAYKNLKEARKKYRHLKQSYKHAKVEMLREDKDKAIIDIVIDQCYEAPLVYYPDWRERELGKKIVYVSIGIDGDKVVVSGNTYPVKEELKRLGFRWDPVEEVWYAPVKAGLIGTVRRELSKIPEVEVIVEGE
jgi:hypothetical protein